MKIFLLILGLLFAVILQITFLPFISFIGVGPNLVLVVILILVITQKFEKVWWLILLTGLFLDFLVGLPLGLVSLSLISTAYLIDRFNQSVFSKVSFWVLIILVASGSLIYNLLLLNFSLRYLLIEIVYNLIIALIFYVGFKKIFR